jgi:ribulose kinase
MASSNPRVAKKLPVDVKAALSAAVTRAGTQTKVAAELGVSGAVVSQLLRDAYLGDVATHASRIRGLYMAETVTCPVMGTLGRNHCLDYQGRPLAFTNPQRAALHQACKTCANRKELA